MLKHPFNGVPVITRGFVPKVHLGVDYAMAHRTAVIAVTSGVVSKLNDTETRNWIANTPTDPYKKGIGKVIYFRALNSADYGKYIKVDHGNGVSTLHAHLDEVVVFNGQHVKEGELLGYSDNTGNSTGSHLHFEIRKSDIVIDPEKFDFSFNGEGGVIPEDIEYTDKVRITVPILYVRSGPAKTYNLSGSKELHKNDIVEVIGFTEGEEIEENKIWYKSIKGNYFWSGGTDKPNPAVPKEGEVKMTKEEFEARKLELDNRRTSLEGRKTELEEATKSNNKLIDVFNKDWEVFVAEPIEGEVVSDPVVAEVPVEEVKVEESVVAEVLHEVKPDEGLSAEEEKEAAREALSKAEELAKSIKERFGL